MPFVLLVLTPLPSFYCWRGGSTAGPEGPKPTGNCSRDLGNKLFDVIARRTTLKFSEAFDIDGASGCHMVIDRKQDMFFVLLEQTPSERQRVQRTLEQLVYESLEN